MTKSQPPSRSLDKFLVRLPPGMRELLEEAAKRAGRTMTAEIVQRLEDSFPTIETLILKNRRAEVDAIQKSLERYGARIKVIKGLLERDPDDLDLLAELNDLNLRTAWLNKLTDPILEQAQMINEAARRAAEGGGSAANRSKTRKRTR